MTHSQEVFNAYGTYVALILGVAIPVAVSVYVFAKVVQFFCSFWRSR